MSTDNTYVDNPVRGEGRTPDNARAGFPFTSETARYIWVAFDRGFPDSYYSRFGTSPEHGSVGTHLRTFIRDFEAGCAREKVKVPPGLFDSALLALEVWDSTPIQGSGNVATFAIQKVFDAIDEAIRSVPKSKDLVLQKEILYLVAAQARVLESVVTTLEFTSSHQPAISRALWDVAMLVPYNGPRLEGRSLTEVAGELLNDMQKDRKFDSDVSKAAEKLKIALEKFEKAGGGRDQSIPDHVLNPILTDIATNVAQLAKGFRSTVRREYAKKLESLLGETWARLDLSFRNAERVKGGKTIGRSPITIGTHREPGTFFETPRGPDLREPTGDPVRKPPPKVDPPHVEPPRSPREPKDPVI